MRLSRGFEQVPQSKCQKIRLYQPPHENEGSAPSVMQVSLLHVYSHGSWFGNGGLARMLVKARSEWIGCFKAF